MICNNCNSSSIKSRNTYTHGKKSKATKIVNCKNCGSADIELKSDARGRKPFKRK